MPKHGASEVVNARSANNVAEAAASISAAGHKTHQAVFDVTDAQTVEAEVDRIEKEIGPIDILINNAGMHSAAGRLSRGEVPGGCCA